ncbi:MAG: hypothetical protein AB7F43_07715 [Bacteriovoracia bacterium]
MLRYLTQKLTLPLALFIGVFLYSSIAIAETPPWFSDRGLNRNGNSLTVTCLGSGPAKDIAEKMALDQCRAIASEQIKGYSFNINSISIQDNRQSAWHSEVFSNSEVMGLICNPVKEVTEQGNSGEVTSYLMCDFDLNKAKIKVITERKKVDSEQLETSSENKQSFAIPSSIVSFKNENKLVEGNNRQLIITTIPICDDILVRGRSRSIRCDENPKTILIYPEDKEIIVRLRGYLPKHIELNTSRAPSSIPSSLEVYLEKN